MTRLDLLKFDKNGCTDLIAVWCYRCTGGSNTGKAYTKMGNNRGKGRMIFTSEVDFPETNLQRYRYECVICKYSFNYTKTYVEKYAIR